MIFKMLNITIMYLTQKEQKDTNNSFRLFTQLSKSIYKHKNDG